jgi:hypothetical protein
MDDVVIHVMEWLGLTMRGMIEARSDDIATVAAAVEELRTRERELTRSINELKAIQIQMCLQINEIRETQPRRRGIFFTR